MSNQLVDDAGGLPTAGPSEVGLERDALDALLARAQRDVDDGSLPSCQIAIAREGQLVASRTFGAPSSSRYVTFSCTKAITAGAVWCVLGDNRLARDTVVADLVPSFAANGKHTVTVEQLLTHTAGFPSARMTFGEWADREARLSRFAAWSLEWEPGSRCIYHGTSAHWVLAQILEVVTGEDFRDFTRRAVLDRLGLVDLQLGTPVSDQRDVLDVAMVGRGADEAEARAIGLDVSAVVVRDDDVLVHNDPDVRALGQPAGGAIGRAVDLVRYYQALLENPDELWDPDVLRAGTAEVCSRLTDPMIGAPAMRTLGLVAAGDDGMGFMRGFGDHSSPSAFGHMGAGGQIAWADPDTAVCFAYLTNGLDRNPVRIGARGFSLSSRASRLGRTV